ncbi:hypothetical protein ABAC460_09445 [Asticcacaulis sp. AC460]|nr:hypothetical protein ABAC460_09445 [Asticcacaulis sp. AC460]
MILHRRHTDLKETRDLLFLMMPRDQAQNFFLAFG